MYISSSFVINPLINALLLIWLILISFPKVYPLCYLSVVEVNKCITSYNQQRSAGSLLHRTGLLKTSPKHSRIIKWFPTFVIRFGPDVKNNVGQRRHVNLTRFCWSLLTNWCVMRPCRLKHLCSFCRCITDWFVCFFFFVFLKKDISLVRYCNKNISKGCTAPCHTYRLVLEGGLLFYVFWLITRLYRGLSFNASLKAKSRLKWLSCWLWNRIAVYR